MTEGKIKGIVDIVFLIDVSGSMQTCIDAVKQSISVFIGGLSTTDANNEAPIKDWRIRVCGFRDHKNSESDWYVDNPFVRDVEAVKAQLASADMQARGGGDEPESLLDALYKVATTESTGIQESEDPARWRRRGSVARAIIFFTDASFHEPMTYPAAVGGGLADLISKISSERFLICGFCPEWSGYAELGSMDGSNINYVVTLADSPALAGLGKDGAEGRAAQEAAVNGMMSKVTDTAAFVKILEALAKTVQKSSVVDTAVEC
jgi:hypothetical protein